MGVVQKIKIKLLGYRATNESYIKKLKELGVTIGDDVRFYRPYNTTIDVQNPYLLSIGSHVMITGPVTILTHDYSWCVLKRKYGTIEGNQKKVVIGDNVFIGWGATILAGTNIGNNTIIGANSVVSGRLEPDSVYAGSPAKRLMSIDEYYERRRNNQLAEAVEVVLQYKKNKGVYPKASEMDEYFFLFTNGDNQELVDMYKSQLELMGNYEETISVLKKNHPQFETYEAFLEYCIEQEREINE